jgi:hypothetical protein
VPLTGNFAGTKALRAVGQWAAAHGARVTTFYVSNVEQYLFQQTDAWRQFYLNVSTMPLEKRALFIRSVSNRGWRRNQHPYARSSSVTSGISDQLSMFRKGQLHSYADVIAISK